jgi:hypothetical protein
VAYTIDEIVAQYVKLRDKKAELAAQQKDAMKPLSDAMDIMEAELLKRMQADGVDSYKTQAGTAFKAHTASVSMQDAIAFKQFVLAPAIEAIKTYFAAAGFELENNDIDHLTTLLQDQPLWSLADFRAAKKGIQEYIEEKQLPVPGVAVTPVLNINIRRA